MEQLQELFPKWFIGFSTISVALLFMALTTVIIAFMVHFLVKYISYENQRRLS